VYLVMWSSGSRSGAVKPKALVNLPKTARPSGLSVKLVALGPRYRRCSKSILNISLPCLLKMLRNLGGVSWKTIFGVVIYVRPGNGHSGF